MSLAFVSLPIHPLPFAVRQLGAAAPNMERSINEGKRFYFFFFSLSLFSLSLYLSSLVLEFVFPFGSLHEQSSRLLRPRMRLDRRRQRDNADFVVAATEI